jgi:Ni/Co efflux regulator RcnB
MKTLFLTVAATALIFAAPTAFAQDDHHHGHPGGASHAAAPAHTTHTATTHTTHAAAPTHASNTMMMSGSSHADKHHDMTTRAAPTAPPGWTVKGQSHTDRMRRNNTTHSTNAMRGNSTTHGSNTHVTVNFNRRNVTASHHYHYRGGAYHGPSGYSYHRYSYGDMLPSIYFSQDYWINDYSDYGLAYPPPGCVWVRYGDDAILIEQDNGQILEVVYDQFD